MQIKPKITFYVCHIDDADNFAEQCDEVKAWTQEDAAEMAAMDGDLYDDGDECEVVVALRRDGTGAVKFTVAIEIVREYSITAGPEDFAVPSLSDEQDGEDREPKRDVDTLTLSLFGE